MSFRAKRGIYASHTMAAILDSSLRCAPFRMTWLLIVNTSAAVD